jgi:hypothetical protein
MTACRIRTDGFIDPCIPSPRSQAALRPGLGARGQASRLPADRAPDGETVRLFTRRGYEWTERYPAIAAAAAKLRARSFTLDGEVVVAGADGIAVFDALHRRGRVSDAMLQAFGLAGTRRRGLAAVAARPAQASPGAATGSRASWDRAQRPHRCRRSLCPRFGSSVLTALAIIE